MIANAPADARLARAFVDASGHGGNPAWVLPVGARGDLEAALSSARALARATGVEVTLEAAGRDFRFLVPDGELSLCLHGLLAGLALARGQGRLGEDDRPSTVTTPSGELLARVRSVDQATFAVSVGLGPQALAPLDAGGERRAALAAALGLAPADLPGRLWNAGGARLKTLIPLARREQLAAISVDPAAVDRIAPALGSTGLYAFVVERIEGDGAHIAVRHFPAGIGLVEDPATGGSAAAPALWLVRAGGHARLARLTIAQGDDMGRPCRLSVERSGDDDLRGWQVGGRVALEPPPGEERRG
ncbi:PhzF family phenazine biosynthesis protein [Sorangium sp. So ce1036]|uniref:PhzF family phenazine biosynthesis protein n=1 Tax=Sorangium sp. So ce1036 TaxID=3133328 RepID=UPI003EFECA03